MKEPFPHPGFGNGYFLRGMRFLSVCFHIFFYLYFLVFVSPGNLLTKPFVPCKHSLMIVRVFVRGCPDTNSAQDALWVLRGFCSLGPQHSLLKIHIADSESCFIDQALLSAAAFASQKLGLKACITIPGS